MTTTTCNLPVARVLDLGCTFAQHQRLGIHAVINARGGQSWRNWDSLEAVEMKRDAQRVRACIAERVRFYQFNSRCFRRRPELARLLSSHLEN